MIKNFLLRRKIKRLLLTFIVNYITQNKVFALHNIYELDKIFEVYKKI